VIVPTLTFIATVNPVRYVQAQPVFMDCDDSLCMDMDKLEDFCQKECDFRNGKLINKTTKRQIKAVMIVHIFGNMADMPRLMDIAQRYNLEVIEDATEALGTCYLEGGLKGQYAGTIADIGVYSFNGNKIITTGGGGMLVSPDSRILARAKYLSTQAKDDPVNFIHHEIGFNYRMTNLQAAVGVAQLEQLEDFIAIKKENYYRYRDHLRKKVQGLRLLDFRDGIRPNYWFYSLLIDDTRNLSCAKIIAYLKNEDIQARPIWGLVHQQKPYLGNQAYQIEKAVEFQKRIVNLPCSTNLSVQDVDSVVEKIRNISAKE
jgi:perosamine synthetase